MPKCGTEQFDASAYIAAFWKQHKETTTKHPLPHLVVNLRFVASRLDFCGKKIVASKDRISTGFIDETALSCIATLLADAEILRELVMMVESEGTKETHFAIAEFSDQLAELHSCCRFTEEMESIKQAELEAKSGLRKLFNGFSRHFFRLAAILEVEYERETFSLRGNSDNQYAKPGAFRCVNESLFRKPHIYTDSRDYVEGRVRRKVAGGTAAHPVFAYHIGDTKLKWPAATVDQRKII